MISRNTDFCSSRASVNWVGVCTLGSHTIFCRRCKKRAGKYEDVHADLPPGGTVRIFFHLAPPQCDGLFYFQKKGGGNLQGYDVVGGSCVFFSVTNSAVASVSPVSWASDVLQPATDPCPLPLHYLIETTSLHCLHFLPSTLFSVHLFVGALSFH